MYYIYFRARPVVKMQSSLQFISESKQISLEDRTCSLKDTTEVSCLQLSTCLEYSGIGVDKNLDFDVQLLLDSKKPKSPRMFFLSEEGKNVMNQSLRLEKGTRFCKNMNVYIKVCTPFLSNDFFLLLCICILFQNFSKFHSCPLQKTLKISK